MGEVMAGEFFRPYFSNGIWAQSELTPGLWYSANLMNNLSALGVKTTQMDRKLSAGEKAGDRGKRRGITRTHQKERFT